MAVLSLGYSVSNHPMAYTRPSQIWMKLGIVAHLDPTVPILKFGVNQMCGSGITVPKIGRGHLTLSPHISETVKPIVIKLVSLKSYFDRESKTVAIL